MPNKTVLSASKRDFIKFMASGKKKNFINEHDEKPLEFVHPLQHSSEFKSLPDACLIPMNYKFQRKFYERYISMKK